jgi:aminoglycoside N3'-acetyltransferase
LFPRSRGRESFRNSTRSPCGKGIATSATIVTEDDIIQAIKSLGLEGTAIEVHPSLSSFGTVQDEAPAVVRALQRVCDTVAMPSFCDGDEISYGSRGEHPEFGISSVDQ